MVDHSGEATNIPFVVGKRGVIRVEDVVIGCQVTVGERLTRRQARWGKLVRRHGTSNPRQQTSHHFAPRLTPYFNNNITIHFIIKHKQTSKTHPWNVALRKGRVGGHKVVQVLSAVLGNTRPCARVESKEAPVKSALADRGGNRDTRPSASPPATFAQFPLTQDHDIPPCPS